MTAQALYDKMRMASLPRMETAVRGCRALRRLLTFSLADEIVSPRRDILVSIHAGGMSMAYGSRFLSRIKIEQYRECALAEGQYPSPDVLAARVSSFVGECRAIRTPITLSIPKAWAVIRAVDLPSAANENLAGVVSYELDRFTPLNPANAFFDFRLLNERNGWLSVTVAAARCDLIKPYIDALGAKGLPVDRITLHPSATANLLHFVSGCSNVIYLVANGDDYELGHVIDGCVSRAANARFETEDEDARIGKIVFEMSSLVEKIRKCGAPPGSCIIFLNSMDREKLAARAPLPIRTVSDREIARRFPAGLKGISHIALGGLVECLWPKAVATNLLSKGRHHTARTPVMITALLLLALAVLGIACAVAPLQIERAKLQEIERQIALRKDEIRKIELLQKDIDALDGEINSIADLRKKSPGVLTVIKELTAILPKTSWLSRIRISAATVDIEGLATTSPAEFLPGIEASTLFRKVEFAAPTVRDSVMKADRFVMKMELRGAGQEEGRKEGQRVMRKSRLMAFCVPITAALLGLWIYQYGYVGIQSDLSALEDLRAAKSRILEKHIQMISQKPQLDEKIALLRESAKAHRSKIIDAPTRASAAAALQNAVKGMIAGRGGTISSEQVDKPEKSGKFLLVGAGFDAVLPDIQALNDTLLAIETHTPCFMIRELDVRAKNYREPKELIVRLKVAALTDGR